MSNLIAAVKAFADDENGITAIEYGLMAAFIGLVVAGGATVLGSDISNAFKTIGGKLTTAVGP